MHNLEREPVFPSLAGHSVLIVERKVIAGELFAELAVRQEMRVDFIDEMQFPSDIKEYMSFRKLESSLIHLPNVVSDDGLRFYSVNILSAYQLFPKMILLEGFPTEAKTIEMYKKLEELGIPVIEKIKIGEITAHLAKYFE